MLPATKVPIPAFRSLFFSLLTLLLWCHLPAAQAQEAPLAPLDSRLPQLLSARATLTRRYAEASAQRNSLFGNKPSKKDLQEVVDALQSIVDKDQQIVDVLDETAQKATSTSVRLAATTTHLEASSRDDRNLTSQRLAELENESANLRQREKQQLAKQRDLEEELAETKQGRLVRDVLVAGLALACIGLLVARNRQK